jgi:multiple sugar transport system ATP-binding protein
MRSPRLQGSQSVADVRFEQATRVYPGTNVPAVDALDLHISDSELMVLVGPSGSGKSTALRMIAGLEEVDSGGIWVGGRDVTYVAPKDRDVAMVFQNYALYPYLTVAANIAFPLKMAKVPKRERELKVREVAAVLELTELLERKPAQLSGGQRQRVAIARALVNNPSILLADEPTGNLDSQTSEEIMKVFEGLASQGQTVIMVTHEADIAAHARRVVVLRDGVIASDDRRSAFTARVGL